MTNESTEIAAPGVIYIDPASAQSLATILRDTAATSAPTDHPVDAGFRAGIECAAKTLLTIAERCASRIPAGSVPEGNDSASETGRASSRQITTTHGGAV